MKSQDAETEKAFLVVLLHFFICNFFPTYFFSLVLLYCRQIQRNLKMRDRKGLFSCLIRFFLSAISSLYFLKCWSIDWKRYRLVLFGVMCQILNYLDHRPFLWSNRISFQYEVVLVMQRSGRASCYGFLAFSLGFHQLGFFFPLPDL